MNEDPLWLPNLRPKCPTCGTHLDKADRPCPFGCPKEKR